MLFNTEHVCDCTLADVGDKIPLTLRKTGWAQNANSVDFLNGLQFNPIALKTVSFPMA